MDSPKTRPKNRRKKWLFMCFKPHDSFRAKSIRGKPDPLLTYISVAEKEGIVSPAIFSSSPSTAAEGGGADAARRIKKGKLRKALKTALNETSWGRKIIKRRKTNKDNLPISNKNLEEGEGDEVLDIEPKTITRTNSNASSSSPAFNLSSLSSSISSCCSSLVTPASGPSHELCAPKALPINGSTGATKQKQDDVENRRKGYCGLNKALCLLLTSLVVLILWGKFCAILCTSISFFVVPPRRRRPSNEGVLYEEIGLDSVQDKKKIIMECLRGAVAVSR